jgi:hypothetical protein
VHPRLVIQQLYDFAKRVIIFALVLLGALAPVASVAEAHWDDACHCDETEAP